MPGSSSAWRRFRSSSSTSKVRDCPIGSLRFPVSRFAWTMSGRYWIRLARHVRLCSVHPKVALWLHYSPRPIPSVSPRLSCMAPMRVLATVLFTDIVSSTDAAVRLGDRRWQETLEAHDALIRRELGAFRGLEIGTAGDGFLATFDGPARAIRCACSISNAVRKLGIEVRAGLHTGECERMGDNIGGIAVHIGARVAALARDGEVLVSRTVKDLVAGSGLSFQDRGPHGLKGIPGEWQLFAVEH